MEVTLFSDVHSKKVKRNQSFKNAAEMITFFGASALKRALTANKFDAELFLAATVDTNNPRGIKGIKQVHAVTLDVDDPRTKEEAEAVLSALRDKFAYVAYTTYSSEPEKLKLRIVVPLKTPMSAEEFKASEATARVAALFQVKVDSTCSNAAQLYLMPSCPPGNESIHFSFKSDSEEPLDLASLPPLTKQEAAKWLSKKNASAGKKAEDLSQIEQRANEVIQQRCGGVAPLYVGGRFWIYHDGSWGVVNEAALFRDALLEVFEKRITLADVGTVMTWLKRAFYNDTFPSGHSHTLVNLAGQTVDLQTGSIVPNDPDNYLSNRIPHAYNIAATCPRFLQYLREVFHDDVDLEEKILLVQELLGYCLMSSARFAKMFFLTGFGANGKSVLIAVIRKLVGERNASSLSLAQIPGTFSTGELQNKLVNVSDEVGADSYLTDAVIKNVVSGDMISAQFKFKDVFTFTPYATLITSMNNTPKSRDQSDGYFRRIIIIAFNRKFTEAEQDTQLIDKLSAEMEGILQFAIEGAKRLLANRRFTTPVSSTQHLQEYRVDNNPIACFVRDVLTISQPNDKGLRKKTDKKFVYEAYRTYCQQCGFLPMNVVNFGKGLAALGIEQPKSKSSTGYYVGVRSSSEWMLDINAYNDEVDAGPQQPQEPPRIPSTLADAGF